MTTCPACGGAIPAGMSVCPRCATLADDGGGKGAVDATARRIAHFAILRELGVGGMGAVYLARDEKMNRDVALKVMSRATGSEKSERRFEQEAWIAGRLDHPNIVRVYERGVWEGQPYFSMELVDGGSLADVISRMRLVGRDESRNLTFGSSDYVHWAIQTIVEAARGLDSAHRQGVVHRDIKPMNLLLNRKLGMVKIADFGLAIDVEATRMTTVGTVMGTISFMAPEQVRGDSDQIDARTDVYALGVTLFELLTLELPYTGRTQQIYMSQVLTSEARRARSLNNRVGRDLEIVLRKALEKASKDRYQTAALFADDLDNVLHLRPIVAKPTGPWRRGMKWVRRKPMHAALAATLAVALPTVGMVAARAVAERRAAARAHIAHLLDEARWLEERGEYGAMLERAEAALALAPGSPIALRHRAMARFMLGKSVEDKAARDKLRQQALEDASGVTARLPGVAWPHALEAYMLGVMGRKDEAAAAAAEAERLHASTPSDDDLGEEARLALASGEHGRALGLYSELIGRHPDSATAISSRALMHERLGDPQSAFVDYRVAVGLDPKYDLAFTDLARLSADGRHLDDAEKYLARALEINPANEYALEVKGRILADRGREARTHGDLEKARRLFKDAAAATQAALQRSNRLVWAELNLAGMSSELAKLVEPPDAGLMATAIDGYRKVMDRYGARPAGGQERDVYDAALMNTCDAQITMSRLQEAQATCWRIAEVHPDQAVAFYNLAGVYALLGRNAEALAALERDVALGDVDADYLAADPWFAKIRTDRKFVELLDDMRRKGSKASR